MLHISLAAERLTEFFGFPITNSLVMSWLTVALLVGTAVTVRRTLALIPRGLQNGVELLVESMVAFMAQVVGEEKAKRFFPLVATLFLFVLISNWLGIFPGVGPVGIIEDVHGTSVLVPFFRSTYADINMTLALALISVAAVQYYGMRMLGVGKHLKKFFTLKSPIDAFMGILELFGELAKVVSFSFRLFGNVFAGEVLLVVIAFLVPFLAPLPFLGLELFVGFVQALIFSTLTLVFLQIATVEHH